MCYQTLHKNRLKRIDRETMWSETEADGNYGVPHTCCGWQQDLHTSCKKNMQKMQMCVTLEHLPQNLSPFTQWHFLLTQAVVAEFFRPLKRHKNIHTSSNSSQNYFDYCAGFSQPEFNTQHLYKHKAQNNEQKRKWMCICTVFM